MQSFKQLTEQELVQAFANGTEQAISELVCRTKGKLYTTIYVLVKDKYLAEDILQDAYIKAIDKIRQGHFSNDGKFCAWISRIARNLCMDYFRKGEGKAKIVLSDGRDIFDYLDLQDDNIQDRMMSKQSGSRVRQLLELIPQDQTDVIVMLLFGNKSFKEIAEESNTTLNTCLGRMRYGLLNIRKIVEERQLVI
jgi:RNA polymerase sigma-70 factor (ECF subfamily)